MDQGTTDRGSDYNLHYHLDEAWRWASGLPEGKQPIKLNSAGTLEELKDEINNDYFSKITEYADNRLVMGRFRYGPLDAAKLQKFNPVEDAKTRLSLYQSDNNLEHLVDAFNYVRIAYMRESYRGIKLHPIDDGVHSERID
jgi:hypothetical protein